MHFLSVADRNIMSPSVTRKSPALRPDGSRCPVRLVIADDHAVVRQGIHGMLAGTEMAIIAEADDGLEAERLARTLLPDLLLLDIALPGQRGIAVLHALRAAGFTFPVVFFSMYPASQYAEHVCRAGAQGFISKDAGRDVLLAGLRQAMMPVHAQSGQKPTTNPPPPETGHTATATESGTQTHPDPARLDSLSRREQAVFQALIQGYSARAIAEQLGISDKSVGTYRRRLLDKLGLSGNAELIALAARNDLV